MLPLYILLTAVLVVSAYIAWSLHQSRSMQDPHLTAELERRTEEIGELKNQIAQLKEEHSRLETNGKNIFANLSKLESDYKALQKERDVLSIRVTKFETEAEQRQKRHEELIAQQEEARKALEDEKLRIRREDDERQKKLMEERDRIWNDHEQHVNALLTELCKKPQFAFSSFDNTNLPEGFDGSLKPDFMISFLEQYIIFDSKVSRSQDLQTYLRDAVKKTAKKVQGNDHIYSTIYFVVPTDAIPSLKQTSYYEEGFTFYIISPEALEPIFASLKRIETYEFAQEMDPQERENIIDMIAQFDFHISTRNAVDYHLLQHGIDTLAKMRGTDSDFIREVMIKRQKMRNLNFNTAETKKLVASPQEVHEKLLELTEPQPKLRSEDL